MDDMRVKRSAEAVGTENIASTETQKIKYLAQQKEIVLISSINYMMTGDLKQLKLTTSTYIDPLITLGKAKKSYPNLVVPTKQQSTSSRDTSNLPSGSSQVESVSQVVLPLLSAQLASISTPLFATLEIPSSFASPYKFLENSGRWSALDIKLLFSTVDKYKKKYGLSSIKWKVIASVFDNRFNESQCYEQYKNVDAEINKRIREGLNSKVATKEEEMSSERQIALMEEEESKMKVENLKKAIKVLDQYLQYHSISLQKSRTILNSNVPFTLNPDDQSIFRSGLDESSAIHNILSPTEGIPDSILSSIILHHLLYKSWDLRSLLMLLTAIRETDLIPVPFIRWNKIAKLVEDGRNSLECQWAFDMVFRNKNLEIVDSEILYVD